METIGFIGAGKVGKALGLYFQQHQHSVIGYYSRTYESARKVASQLQVPDYKTMDELVNLSTLIFITTNDDQLQSVDEALGNCPINLKGKIIVHCSGAHSSHLLTQSKVRGAYVYSFHPLQAFAGSDQDVTLLQNTFFTLESPEGQDTKRIKQFLGTFKNPVTWIKEDQKILYHAAAVMMSNYMVTIIQEGLIYLNTIGISPTQGLKMMAPLLDGTLHNILEKGPIDGLTGPLIRGDLSVISGHMNAIENQIGPEANSFYKVLLNQTLTTIGKQRLPKASYIALQSYIKES